MIERLSPRQVGTNLVAALRLTLTAAPGATIAYALNSAVSGLMPVAAAWLTKLLLDRLGAPGAWPALLGPVSGLVVLGVLMGVSPAVGQYLHGRLNRAVAILSMDRLYHSVGQLNGMGHIEDPQFRDQLVVAQQAGRGGPGRLVEHAFGIARGMLTLSGFVVALFLLDPWLALVVLLAGAPALAAQLRLSRERATLLGRLAPLERRELHYADLLVSLPAAKELRLLGLGPLFRERMVREMRAAGGEQEQQDRREAGAETALAVLASVVTGASLLWAVWLAANGHLTVGDVAMLIAAVAGVQASVQAIVALVAGAHEALLLFHQFRAVTDIGPDLSVPEIPAPTPVLAEGITFTDVWFRYGPDQPWVLRGLHLTIRQGEATALVGLNGAGKSTLIKLLCRFYDPTRGAIRWDGTDLREMDPVAFRSRIGALFQDFMEYDLAVAENIGVGDVEALADRARITAAAERADAHDLVGRLPSGYDTLLSRIFMDDAGPDGGRTGTLLSGGQWQRIALARAFMRDRRDLMILDEPTSGLDPEAEYEIHRRLRQHRSGTTSVLVSHRLSAVRDADTIVVLCDGRVSERGTHNQLMDNRGPYARLYRLQADGYADGQTTLAAQAS
ncbi:ATP-binding cassette, subfamily B [Asanoa hainanensis]|uniref:ATP-binding cassette, subfamily B n=1 Tax=Asanoa hainanensis TaxID=560556 RepID=A0A239PFR5_9ACTN|nr:ABC transporter ATP-binding protein [Asanoa hainanensis]SNT65478.1 ATP-binding cassette, subfamily B [Asanoa hainanensis]